MRQSELDILLDLHGEISVVTADGHWVKFVVYRVQENHDIPHGISYSLTLHSKSGVRLVGFDNAHSIQTGKPYDHKHIGLNTKGRKYVFQSAGKLLQDFWAEVDKMLEKEVHHE